MASKVDSLKHQAAAAIAQSIQNKGYSQREAATLCGVSQSRISNVAGGHLKDFSLDALVRIANSLGCSVSMDILPAERTRAMAEAYMLPHNLSVDPSGYRQGCEDEFRLP